MTTKHFAYIAGRIAAAKQQADNLATGIGHRGIEGEIREIAARECVDPFLTQSYRCGRGKVINSYQRMSDQIDLIVYHRKVAPPILVNEDLGLFPVECVRYVFEIKSTLTATEVKDANKKFRSVANLTSFPLKQAGGTIRKGTLPSTVLFAFNSDLAGSEIQRYLKHTPDEYPPCVALCVLGKGYWFFDKETKKWHGQETTADHAPYTEFCMFIGGFMNTLAAEETSLRPFSPAAYISKEEIIFKPVTVFGDEPL